MKEIKFRAWNKEEKCMIKKLYFVYETENGLNSLYNDKDQCLDEDEYVLMQFTGVKGKDGVELYEGDIVKGALKDEVYIIEFFGGCFCYHRIGKENGWSNFNRESYGNFKVIGNIYENPEMLNNGGKDQGRLFIKAWLSLKKDSEVLYTNYSFEI